MKEEETMILYKNGYIVKRLDSNWAKKYKHNYAGIEGDVWPLDLFDGDIDNDSQELMECIEEKIEQSQYKDTYVGVCEDRDLVFQYAEICKNLGFEIEVLFVETSKSMPQGEIIHDGEIILLGFDYGFSGPDYYSCIYNDIVRRNLEVFKSIRVNRYGLLDNEKMLEKFINIRNKDIAQSTANKYESGNYIPYRIWRVVV